MVPGFTSHQKAVLQGVERIFANKEVLSEEEVVITIKSIVQSLLLSLVLVCSGTASALEGALLGLTTGVPLVSASPLGSCSYTNGVLTIETTPSSINFDGDTNTNDIFNVAGTAIGGTLTYTLVIDNLGNLNPVGSSLTMSGLTQDAVSTIIYGLGGPLLTGAITNFGIRDDGTNDVMDIRASLTGGELAPLYPASADIASVLLLNISDYTFSGGTSGFDGDWTCIDPKADVGPFGDEEVCDLTITKVVDKPQIGPFPPFGDDSDSDTDSDSGIDHDGDGHTDNSDTDSGEPNESDSGPLPTDCGCKGKVSKLALQYNGPDASITITRKPHDVIVFGPQIVVTGEVINLVGPLSGSPGFQGTLGTRIEIMASPGGITEIHTSCSQPIGPGLIVGDWEVLSGESKKLNVPLCPVPPTLCVGEIVTYTYTVTNGGSPLTGVQVTDIPLGPIGAPFDMASGDVVVLMEQVCITETTHNTVTASGNLPGGALCTSNEAEAWVEILLPPDPGECPVPGSSDSDSGIDGNGNADTDDTDSDSGDADCDDDSDEEPPTGVVEGCTPGYWKQRQHFDSWVAFSPGDKFEDAFPGVNAATGNKTLLKVLKTGGGKSKALGRHAVAALLNASSPDVDYMYDVNGVQQIVSDAYAAGTKESFNAAKDVLRAANEQGCPLN
ncbi:MAG: hypothetical protein V3S33_04205 [Gammaproteobacteria bacterium]